MVLYEELLKIDNDWLPELQKHESSIKQVFNMIEKTRLEYYPVIDNVFNAFKLTTLSKVKCVIWGQDPYPTTLDSGEPRAQGYSFGVHKDDDIPKSLKNIFKEIKQNFPDYEIPDHGDLTHIAKQGVLFMNSALTYAVDEPTAHINLWKRFIYIVITIINKNIENCIHIIWGKKAEKLVEHINSREVYISGHPSPLSCRHFFGCKHFLKINITLKRQNKKQINWNEDENLVPTYVEFLKT